MPPAFFQSDDTFSDNGTMSFRQLHFFCVFKLFPWLKVVKYMFKGVTVCTFTFVKINVHPLSKLSDGKPLSPLLTLN